MIDRNRELAEADRSENRFKPLVLEGRKPFMDVEAFAATLSMLENYVDMHLLMDDSPPMDPWVDDAGLEVRVNSL